MAKLCAKGKAAAKRKFKVYPSAYANMYGSAVCSGKVTPGGKKGSRKKAMGGGMMRKEFGKGGGADTHVTKDGRTVKKGLYYYMNRAKKNKTSKPGKGSVTDKALKASAKTAKKPTKKA